MNDPDSELKALRKSLEDLRERVHDRDIQYSRDHGYTEGWRETMEVRFAALERRLDSLLFALLERAHQKTSADIPPAATVAAPPSDTSGSTAQA